LGLVSNVVTNRARSTRARFVDQAVKALFGETSVPLRHRCRVAPDLAGDLLACRLFGARTGEHDLAAQRKALSRRVSTRPALELSAFVSRGRDLSGWSSSLGHDVPFDAGSDTNKNATLNTKIPELNN
jgi:hypothetical protein